MTTFAVTAIPDSLVWRPRPFWIWREILVTVSGMSSVCWECFMYFYINFITFLSFLTISDVVDKTRSVVNIIVYTELSYCHHGSPTECEESRRDPRWSHWGHQNIRFRGSKIERWNNWWKSAAGTQTTTVSTITSTRTNRQSSRLGVWLIIIERPALPLSGQNVSLTKFLKKSWPKVWYVKQ